MLHLFLIPLISLLFFLGSAAQALGSEIPDWHQLEFEKPTAELERLAQSSRSSDTLTRFKSQMAQAAILLYLGRFEESKELLNEIQQSEKFQTQSLHYQLLQAFFLQSTGHFKKAIAIYQELAPAINDEEVLAWTYLKQAFAAYFILEEGEPNSHILELFERAQRLFKKNNKPIGLAYCYLMFAANHRLSDRMKAFSILKNVEKIAADSNSKLLETEIFKFKFALLVPEGKHQEANKLLETFNLADVTNARLANMLKAQIAGLTAVMGDHATGISQVKEALPFFEKRNNPKELYYAYAQLANFYSWGARYEEAIKYEFKVHEICLKQEWKRCMVRSLGSIGHGYLALQQEKKA